MLAGAVLRLNLAFRLDGAAVVVALLGVVALVDGEIVLLVRLPVVGKARLRAGESGHREQSENQNSLRRETC